MDENKFKEAVAAAMKDKNREALAQLIIEYVQPNHITVDYVGMLLNSRSLNIGDSLVKKIRRGIEVRTWVPGSQSLRSEITVSDRINWVLDAAIVGVRANEWDLEAGEIGTVADLRREASLKLKDYYQNKVFTALSQVWTAANTPDNYTDCGGDISQTALENMINHINQTTSGAKAIFGVRSALQPITKFAAWWNNGSDKAYSMDIVDSIIKTGWMGSYMGVPIMAVNQVYNNPEDYTALLPTDKVLVIGEGVGEFITYGPERYKEWTDNEPTPPYWHMDIVQQFGIMVDNAQGIGVLKVS